MESVYLFSGKLSSFLSSSILKHAEHFYSQKLFLSMFPVCSFFLPLSNVLWARVKKLQSLHRPRNRQIRLADPSTERGNERKIFPLLKKRRVFPD